MPLYTHKLPIPSVSLARSSALLLRPKIQANPVHVPISGVPSFWYPKYSLSQVLVKEREGPPLLKEKVFQCTEPIPQALEGWKSNRAGSGSPGVVHGRKELPCRAGRKGKRCPHQAPGVGGGAYPNLWEGPLCSWPSSLWGRGTRLRHWRADPLFFLLKDNCFTEFCCFLSNLNMNQP